MPPRQKDGLEIVREFIEVESAKTAGRKQFSEMVTFFKRNRSCRILLVEKTDRLYRNFSGTLSRWKTWTSRFTS